MRPEKAALMGAKLPLLTRALFFDGWDPAQRVLYAVKEDFLQRMRLYLRNSPGVEAETIAPAVLRIVCNRFLGGSRSGMLQILPECVLDFWPASN